MINPALNHIIEANEIDLSRAGETQIAAASSSSSMFRMRTANQVIKEARQTGTPRRLLGDLWREGELFLLFSDTGHGKSILSVQAADIITGNRQCPTLGSNCEPQPVLLFDFELSDKQFEGRYSREESGRYTDPYCFQESLVRVDLSTDELDVINGDSYHDYLLTQMESVIAASNAKAVVIDNITFLRSGTETAKDALPLMKGLIALKKRYSLSMMVLAHTPKRDFSRPLSVNDLQGSKMLSNFADTVVGIGASAKDQSIRYIKQVKVRSGPFTYDSENVLTCQIVKPDNFLCYEVLGTSREREHLRDVNEDTRLNLIREAKTLAAKGVTHRRIAEDLGISVGAANKYVNSELFTP